MKTKTLLKLSIISALIGLLALVYLSETLEPSPINIAKIDESMLEQYVKIHGEVTDIRETPGLFILDIKDNSGNIKVVLFKEKDTQIKEGIKVEVIGKVTTYHNILEIEAEEIRKL